MTRWITDSDGYPLRGSSSIPTALTLAAGIALSLIGQGSIAAEPRATTSTTASLAVTSDVNDQFESTDDVDDTDYGDSGDLIVQLYLRDIQIGRAHV